MNISSPNLAMLPLELWVKIAEDDPCIWYPLSFVIKIFSEYSRHPDVIKTMKRKFSKKIEIRYINSYSFTCIENFQILPSGWVHGKYKSREYVQSNVSGKLIPKVTTCIFIDDKLSGPFMVYYYNNQTNEKIIKEVSQYQDDLLHGFQCEYDIRLWNEYTITEKYYNKGIEESMYIEKLESDCINKSNYKNGKRHGLRSVYSCHQKATICEAIYENGVPVWFVVSTQQLF